MRIIDWALFITFLIMSGLAVYMTVHDKAAAKRGSHRTPEANLLILGFFGGALAELITMLIIRHKTRHLIFMIGLPLMIALHVALACVYFSWLRRVLI